MSQLVILLVVYIVLLLVCFPTSKRNILTPQFLFLAGFIFEIIYAFNYIEKYSLFLSDETMYVLISGAVLFVLFSQITSKATKRIRIHPYTSKSDSFASALQYMDSWKLILCLLFQLLAVYLTIRYLRQLNVGSLLEAIYIYRASALGYATQITVETSIPTLIRLIRRICIGSGFFWVYIIVYGLVNKEKKGRLLVIANFFLSIICDFLLGGRKGTVQLIFCGAIIYYLLTGNKKGWKHVLKIKHIIIGVILVFTVLSLFSTTAQLLGRTVTSTNTDYLALYLAAPLKNLDIYISQNNMGVKDGYFLSLYGWAEFLTNYLHVAALNQGQGYPYHKVNGLSLGNAYTTYYAFLHDYSYIGIAIFIPLMAIISQLLFKRSLKAYQNDISIVMIAYAFLSYGVFLCFFDNTFFSSLIIVKTVEYFITWIFLRWFIRKKFLLGHKAVATTGM